jgi:rhodanese-related sulfurtransferase
MFKKIFTVILTTSILVLSTPVWSYDAASAEVYKDMFASAKGATVGKEIHLMSVEKFVDLVKAKKPMVALDVRTPAEMIVMGMYLPRTLYIPLNELFTKANLDQIPTDVPVIIFCQSGIRSVAAATGLRAIGFNNIWVVKGGMKALITYMGPLEANSPLVEAAK